MNKIISGLPGTGKSYQLLKLFNEFTNVKVLTLTHMNKTNLIDMNAHIYGTHLNIDTIHKAFNINIVNNTQFKRVKCEYDMLLVDEYSQIPTKVVDIIISYRIKTVWIGDCSQLNPIQQNNLNPSCSIDLSQYNLTTIETITIAHKLCNSNIYHKKLKTYDTMVLKHNHRSTDHVQQIYNNMISGHIDIIDSKQLIDCVNNGYYVLSSRFKHLKHVNSLMPHGDDETLCRIGLVKSDSPFKMLTKLGKYENNSTVHVIDNKIENTIDLAVNNNHLHICPDQYQTIHRSQGRSLDKCVVVLDSLFTCDLISTAVHRSISDCVFYIINVNTEYVLDNVHHMNKCFEIVKSIIYQ